MRAQARNSLIVAGTALLLAACSDATDSTGPNDAPPPLTNLGQAPSRAQRAAWFRDAAPEALALPATVFAADDDARGQLVFGVEHPAAAPGVRAVLGRRGIPASGYRVEIVEPIHQVATLRDAFRPTVGGIQIHFGGYLCTLGFNVDYGSTPSFITNSHCTNNQGVNDGTDYYQPLSSSSGVVADEVDDPAYSSLSGCSSGKRCRYSDAARAAYRAGVGSTRGEIARTSGANNGSLTVDGSFYVTEESNSTTFSGTINKVGRTTGWTQGNVVATCATVNVSGSDIQLLCQTMVQKRGKRIVNGGDSGSPTFQIISGTTVRLVGILWGGSSNGDLFVMSPLKGIEDELGGLTATFSGDIPGGEDPPTEDPPCVPKGKGNNCK